MYLMIKLVSKTYMNIEYARIVKISFNIDDYSLQKGFRSDFEKKYTLIKRNTN